MENFNCDKMIEGALYGDKMHTTEQSVNDEVLCPKACLLSCYTLKSMYFFFTKVHNFKV